MEQRLMQASTRQRVEYIEKELIPELKRPETAQQNGQGDAELARVVGLLVQTCFVYIDRASRLAVRRALPPLANAFPDLNTFALAVVSQVRQHIPVRAPLCDASSLFCVLDLVNTAIDLAAWEHGVAHASDLLQLQADTYAQLLAMADAHVSMQTSATRTTRTVVRKALRRAGSDVILRYFDVLLPPLNGAKQLEAQATNLCMIGLVCDVAQHADARSPVIERRDGILQFYAGSVCGAKAPAPHYVQRALAGFFTAFVHVDLLNQTLVPTVQKTLLRSPEVVLNRVIPYLAEALPQQDDAGAIAEALWAQLLNCLKSSQSSVRHDAQESLLALGARVRDPHTCERLMKGVLEPVSLNRVTNSEQRVAHVTVLNELFAHITKVADVQNIVAAVSTLFSKETNDAVVLELSKFLVAYLRKAIASNTEFIPAVQLLICKVLTDKRPAVRRMWQDSFASMYLGNIHIPHEMDKLYCESQLALYKEIIKSPAPVLQNGGIISGYFYLYYNAVIQPLPSTMEAELSPERRNKFLFADKIYTRLADPRDITWALRAMCSCFEYMDNETMCSRDVLDAVLRLLFNDKLSHHDLDAVCDIVAKTFVRKRIVLTVILERAWELVHSLEVKDDDSDSAYPVRAIVKLVAHVTTLKPKITYLLEFLEQLLLLSNDDLFISQLDWVRCCQKVDADPAQLLQKHMRQFIGPISTIARQRDIRRAAALRTIGKINFYNPEAARPAILGLLRRLLQPDWSRVTPEALSIWRTPDGTLYHNVLKQADSKDSEYAEWEADIRRRQAAKAAAERKLTRQEQAAVDKQLIAERKIRAEIEETYLGVDFGLRAIQSMCTSVKVEPEQWLQAVFDMMTKEFVAMSEQVCKDLAYAALHDLFLVSEELQGMTYLMVDALQILWHERASDLATVQRVLHRLRFISDARPLGIVDFICSINVVLAAMAAVKTMRISAEDKTEVIILCMDFISLNADSFGTRLTPVAAVLERLVALLYAFPREHQEIRAALLDVCSKMGSCSVLERDILLRALLCPDSTVRTSVLEGLKSLRITAEPFPLELYLASNDTEEQVSDTALELLLDNGLAIGRTEVQRIVPYLGSDEAFVRTVAARSIASAADALDPKEIWQQMLDLYKEHAKPHVSRDDFGVVTTLDRWEFRAGAAETLLLLVPVMSREMALDTLRFVSAYEGEGQMSEGQVPLCDDNAETCKLMQRMALDVLALHGAAVVEEASQLWQDCLSRATSDTYTENCVILLGATARFYAPADPRTRATVDRLYAAMSTPSESVQMAIADCLPALVSKLSAADSREYYDRLVPLLLDEAYAVQKGASYFMAGLCRGRGLRSFKEYSIIAMLQGAIADKHSSHARRGALFFIEAASHTLDRTLEPYVAQIIPLLLTAFGDTAADVREATMQASRQVMSRLSGFGVRLTLPSLLDTLNDTQWRPKRAAVEILGQMAFMAPRQLSTSLPIIVPRLTQVVADSHAQVRAAANKALLRFGEVITNPEVQTLVPVLLNALSDPTNETDNALNALLRTSFVHVVDAPSLALLVPIVDRGLRERNASTKQKAAQIFGLLSSLTSPSDLETYLSTLLPALHLVLVDPVPRTRATAAKALGVLMERLGEPRFPGLIDSLMQTLSSDVGGVDRQGAAQGLAEVLAGLGLARLEEVLPDIVVQAQSSRAYVREGFLSLLIYLPATFGSRFQPYLARAIPPILSGLADENDDVREASLRAGRMIINRYASRAVDLLLPELERGMFNADARIRASSVQLVGALLERVGARDGESEESEQASEDVALGEHSRPSHASSLINTLGQARYDRILSGIYIVRQDATHTVRTTAADVWKSVVSNTPKTVHAMVPTMCDIIVAHLSSPASDIRAVCVRTLGELVRKLGESVLFTLVPELQAGLKPARPRADRVGACIALQELVASSAPGSLEPYRDTLVSSVRDAVLDGDVHVREAAADTFDRLCDVFGSGVVDDVVPWLLRVVVEDNVEPVESSEHEMLKENNGDAAISEAAQTALSALCEVTQKRSRAVVPMVLPRLLQQPVRPQQAYALTALVPAAGSALDRRIDTIVDALVTSIVSQAPEASEPLREALTAVILNASERDSSVDLLMTHMLTLARATDPRIRQVCLQHMAIFFRRAPEGSSSKRPADWIAVTVGSAFADPDPRVCEAACEAQAALTQSLSKADMEILVRPLAQALATAPALPSAGLRAVLPILLHALMYGRGDEREQAALGLSQVLDKADPVALKPFATQITGPLIRTIGERFGSDVRAAILDTLQRVLRQLSASIRPFVPQLQRIFAKALADPTSEAVRTRAAAALGALVELQPRVDALVMELVAAARTEDAAVRRATLRALGQVVARAGAGMSPASCSAVRQLVEAPDAASVAPLARVAAALSRVEGEGLVLALVSANDAYGLCVLNAVLADRMALSDEAARVLCDRVVTEQQHDSDALATAAALAIGKMLLLRMPERERLVAALVRTLKHAGDARRVALVAIRVAAADGCIAGEDSEGRAEQDVLVPAVFAHVRAPVVPVKLAAEAAFQAVLHMEEHELADIERIAPQLSPGEARSMSEYARRVALRLAQAARDRRATMPDAPDELADDRAEIWSIGPER